MKRANTLLTMTASALTLLAAQNISAATAPAHACASYPSDAEPETNDTLVHSATRSLIESFGELSKTANKLSETALKYWKPKRASMRTDPATAPRQAAILQQAAIRRLRERRKQRRRPSSPSGTPSTSPCATPSANQPESRHGIQRKRTAKGDATSGCPTTT